jgi:hypothetical protein
MLLQICVTTLLLESMESKFNIYKALIMRAKEILLGFYNGIFRTGEIPEKWFLTKVVLKPGKNPAPPDSYRPISLIGCDRKLMEKMLRPFLNSLLGRRLPQTRASSLIWATLEYTSTVRIKTMLAKIEFHEIDSTSEMYAFIIQGIGGIYSGLCVCMLLWDG